MALHTDACTHIAMQTKARVVSEPTDPTDPTDRTDPTEASTLKENVEAKKKVPSKDIAL